VIDGINLGLPPAVLAEVLVDIARGDYT
jgi:hypothetical protein